MLSTIFSRGRVGDNLAHHPDLQRGDDHRRLPGESPRLDGDLEIIFADGGSTDGTRDMIAPEFTLLEAPKGGPTR